MAIYKRCLVCNSEFLTYPFDEKNRNYCSLKCYWKARKNNPKYAGYWLGKKRPNMQNEKNPKWKGEEVSYRNLHAWVKRHLKKRGVCDHCGKKKKTDWANKSHKYIRSLIDWLELCRKCHIEYDKLFKGSAIDKYGEEQIYRKNR